MVGLKLENEIRAHSKTSFGLGFFIPRCGNLCLAFIFDEMLKNSHIERLWREGEERENIYVEKKVRKRRVFIKEGDWQWADSDTSKAQKECKRSGWRQPRATSARRVAARAARPTAGGEK